jgi:SAM-dependent methyltransferase
MANQEQIDYWNADAGQRWVEAQQRLDRQLGRVTEALFKTAAIKPGAKVLDVGCGCGETTVIAGKRVGAWGKVLGVDVSEPMLARAGERVAEAGLKWVSLERADAQTHPFPAAAFDLAISRFGVMFFEDAAAAFANIRAALKPGGRFVFACWRPLAENPWMTVPLMLVKDLVELPPPPAPGEPGPFALGDRDRLRSSLEKGGFTDIALTAFDTQLNDAESGDLESAVDFYFQIGPLSRILKEADENTRQRVRDALLDGLKPYHTPEGIVLDAAAWIVETCNA